VPALDEDESSDDLRGKEDKKLARTKSNNEKTI
jgi:hypothetical protein